MHEYVSAFIYIIESPYKDQLIKNGKVLSSVSTSYKINMITEIVVGFLYGKINTLIITFEKA